MPIEIPAPIKLFLEKLLSAAHGQSLPQKLRDQMERDLYGRLQNHLMVSFMQALPNERAEEFDKFMSKEPKQEEIQKFFETNIPDLPEVSARALLEFKDVYLGVSVA